MSAHTPVPPLSVVVVSFSGGPHIRRCLEALRQQVNVDKVEIVVPYDDRRREISGLCQQYPGIRCLPVAGRRTYAELRAYGVQMAQGGIIALTEDHCIPDREWCARILEAHARPYAAIGGVVEKETPDTALNWALYLADYVRYMRPMTEGVRRHLSDCNVSYKRSALEAIAEAWRDEFHEPIVHAALQARGESLWLSARIAVRQQRNIHLRDAVRERYSFGRLFGSGRVPNTSTLRRLLYAGCTALLPPLLVARVAGQVFRKRRCVGAFVHALPALVLLNTVWACGECIGYLTGRPGASLTPQGERVKAQSSSDKVGAT